MRSGGGGFALDFPVTEAGEYTFELEDGRRGTCLLKVRRVQQIAESLTFYHYDLKGVSVLK